METFFTDDDLFDLLEELDQENSEIEILETEAEMQASNRRFEEIILKPNQYAGNLTNTKFPQIGSGFFFP